MKNLCILAIWLFISQSLVGQYGSIVKTTNGSVVTHIEEIAPEISLEIFPNPTKGIIHINNENNYKIEKIDLFASFGQYLKSFNNHESIQLYNLSSGYYFLRIATDHGVHYEKILKE